MAGKKPAKGKLKKNLIAKKKRLLAKYKEMSEQFEAMKESDPFWFFEPSDGSIPERGVVFLKKYLKPDDIPPRLDGQVDIFKSEAQVVGGSGGNQSGKTTYGIIRAYIQATGKLPTSLVGIFPEHLVPKVDTQHRQAIRVACVSNKQFLNTVKPGYQKWCPREYLLHGKWKDSYSAEQNTLKLYEPGTEDQIAYIEFMTNNQDTTDFQGPPLDMVIYDEEPKEEIYKENLLRFTTADRLNIVFCWTPTQGLTWTADKFVENIDASGNKIELFKLCSVTNKCANLDVLDEIIGELTSYEEIKMRLLGEFISLSGLVYGNIFDRQIHIIPPFFEDMDRDKRYDDYLMLTGLAPHSVTPSGMVFTLIDREGNCYIDLCWDETADTDEIKKGWHKIVKEKGYRAGWAIADQSADSTNIAFGGLNIYNELRKMPDGIPAMRTSVKYEGSIKAGVDVMKKRLKGPRIKCNVCQGIPRDEVCEKCDGKGETRGRPTMFIVDRPENKKLITSFRTLERDTYPNEDVKGPKDKIKEGKHHLHSALRFIHQFPMMWYPAVDEIPESDYASGDYY